MTSANFFTGFIGDKPTSRVINPPGGRTNNIFGGCEPEESSVIKKENIRPISNIFGEAEAPKCASRPDRMKSNIFRDDSTKSDQSVSNKKRSGIDPITGRTFEDDEKKDESKKGDQMEGKNAKMIHTSSKILQPPGGKSHKLW
ncbi:hematological and neurological expressed 1 [Brachionus plicatilis]|uniref:Microtubule-associated protein Jupiter n=1 Tax=Brachionus plicatilis TaxID=10195 RepID=A0A3M7P759_BRAPC|nr:hematological and neurological expressed 1 [Brachionus plicatilis]